MTSCSDNFGRLVRKRRRRLEEYPVSNTVEGLTDLVGRGQISVQSATEIAQAVVSDHSVPNPALKAFASLGSSGKHTSNSERDLHRWLKNLYGFRLQSYTIKMDLEATSFDVAPL